MIMQKKTHKTRRMRPIALAVPLSTNRLQSEVDLVESRESHSRKSWVDLELDALLLDLLLVEDLDLRVDRVKEET